MGRGVLTAAAILAVAGIAASSAPAAPRTPTVALSSLERGVLADINAFRAHYHLAPLRFSPALTASARSHNVEMEADGYFEHNSFNGTLFWKRIRTYYPNANFAYWSVGENMLWQSPDVDPQQALTMWENSPEHRKNMLDPHWQEIGISAVHADAAPGVYGGQPVTIVTTDFGVRK
jgi:uncharacterized protein YkwD